MGQKQIKDMAASVRERLLLLAKQTNKSFDAVLRLYCQERFLYRLSISAYRQNFILKGGLLFLSLPFPVRRPTVDVDFSGNTIAADHDKLKKVFSEIVHIKYPDGIAYHAQRMTIRKIKEWSTFKGSRIIIPAELAKARASLQIDIVFDDAMAKGSQVIVFPTLLDFPKPNILAYPLVLMIAEKFEAIISRQTATSRMKDFFDIAYLAESLSFAGKELQDAFTKTLQHHSIEHRNCEAVFKTEFAQNPGLASLWKGFLARNELQYPADFPAAIEKIKRFLEPIVAGACEGKTWNNKESRWV